MEETGVPGENHFRHVKCCDMTQILSKVTLNTHDSNPLLFPRFKISTLKMIKIRKLSKIKLHLYISVVIYLVMISCHSRVVRDFILQVDYKMKNKTKYQAVGTVSKSNRKTKNTKLSEQYPNLTEKHKIPSCRNSIQI